MSKTKVIQIIEESFMRELIFQHDISDISYNGESLFYFSATRGRQFYKKVSREEVATFLRNVANYANARFSYTDTFLDVSIYKYRLSAMHYALSRYGFIESMSFALRINHHFLAQNPHYIQAEVQSILQTIMQTKKSIIISGTTGVGKTTLQKYLLTLLPAATRILVVDNVLELGDVNTLNDKLDITLWQTRTNDETEIKDYIQKALRFHPDYLIIAESRGSEMKEILQGAISGHPNIVTLHAESAALVYDRIAYLTNISDKAALYRAYPYVVHLAKHEDTDGCINRYISEIRAFSSETGTHETLYRAKEYET